MFCQNCKVEIPPAWISAIQSNVCPACGKEIMNDQAKELLTELTQAMEQMEGNPAGLAGWLLSHYQLRKVGTAEPTEFFGSPKHQSDKQNIKVASNPVHRFLKEKAPQLVNRPNMQELLNQIQSSVEDEELEVSEGSEEVYEEEEEYTAPATVKHVLQNNSVLDNSGPPPSEEELETIKSMFGDTAIEDVAGLPPALMADRMKRLMQSKALAEGSSIGEGTRAFSGIKRM